MLYYIVLDIILMMMHMTIKQFDVMCSSQMYKMMKTKFNRKSEDKKKRRDFYYIDSDNNNNSNDDNNKNLMRK